MADNVIPAIMEKLAAIEQRLREVDDRFLDIEAESRSIMDRIYSIENNGADPYD